MFNNGSWSNLQTTGITRISSAEYSGIESGYIIIRPMTSSTVDSYVRLNQTVNLTGYKYIKIDHIYNQDQNAYLGNQKAYLAVSTSSNTTSFAARATSSSNKGTLILDVGGLSGNYYIYLGGNVSANRYERISQLYLTSV